MKLDKSHWEKYPEVVTAHMRGFNHLEMIPRMIKDAYPYFAEWTFGFCDESNLPIWLSGQWAFVEKSDFPDVESLNDAIPGRFGLVIQGDGRLKFKNSYLMKMPSEYRIAQLEKSHAESKASYNSMVGEDKEGLDITYEERKVKSEPPRKPGRPKKE
jgi:hypothetical protein